MIKAALLMSLVAMAAAAPTPQAIDFGDVIDDQGPPPSVSYASMPTIISVNPSSLASAAAAEITQEPLTLHSTDITATGSALAKRTNIAKRDYSSTCTNAPQPTGAGLVSSPDTASAFLANPYYASVASAAPTPSGYVNKFTALNGENNAYAYLGYALLQSYDTQACASKCDKITGCSAINVAFERAPSVDPGPAGKGCDTPPSTTLIKCVFWGTQVSSANAKNTGQWRSSFQVVVAGSNGYVSTRFPTLTGYTGPSVYDTASINAPLDCNGANTYMGYKSWNDGAPFDANRCAAACTAQSNYNIAHPSPDGTPPMLCKFFNTYNLLKNGQVQSQVCSMYSETWNATYAVNTGYYDKSDHYTIQNSVTYSNSTDAGICKPACGGVNVGQFFALTQTNPTGSLYGSGTASIDRSYTPDQIYFTANSPSDPGAARFYLDAACHIHTINGTLVSDEVASQDGSPGFDAFAYFTTPADVAARKLYQPTCKVSTDGAKALSCQGETGNDFFACPVYWRIGVNLDTSNCANFGLAVTTF